MIDNICNNGFHIIDDFLPTKHYQALIKGLKNKYKQGNFKLAKIGDARHANHQTEIRNDHIYWLDDSLESDAIQVYFDNMNMIKHELNQSLFLGLDTLEAHFAVYQTGSFYKKHIDQFKRTLDRRISCVYYLNQDWQSEHGGELVLYNKQDQPLATVNPVGNRLICFTSDLPHQVNIAHHIRYSIAAWMKVRAGTYS